MKTTYGIMILALFLVLSSCSSARRPVLYPNAHLNRVGQPQADADINACMRAAEASGANANRSEDVAKSTAKKHVSNIIGKLGVENRTTAVATARQLGLLTIQ